jgi:hypothetical protein
VSELAGMAQIWERLPEAFKISRREKNGNARLRSRFGELPVLAQASEVVGYEIAEAALVEIEGVLEPLKEAHTAPLGSNTEKYWNSVAHALAYAAMWKAWRALNEAFRAAREEGA